MVRPLDPGHKINGNDAWLRAEEGLQMRLTIRTKLFGLTLASLIFVVAVSATGYWGITSVSGTTGKVAVIGVAIRNNIEAGMYNDMTREDINAVCTKKDQEQQDAIANLATHSGLVADRAAAARAPGGDPEDSK